MRVTSGIPSRHNQLPTASELDRNSAGIPALFADPTKALAFCAARFLALLTELSAQGSPAHDQFQLEQNRLVCRDKLGHELWLTAETDDNDVEVGIACQKALRDALDAQTLMVSILNVLLACIVANLSQPNLPFRLRYLDLVKILALQDIDQPKAEKVAWMLQAAIMLSLWAGRFQSPDHQTTVVDYVWRIIVQDVVYDEKGQIIDFSLICQAGNGILLYLDRQTPGALHLSYVTAGLLQTICRASRSRLGACRLSIYLLFLLWLRNRGTYTLLTCFEHAYGLQRLQDAAADKQSRRNLLNMWRRDLNWLSEQNWVIQMKNWPDVYAAGFLRECQMPRDYWTVWLGLTLSFEAPDTIQAKIDAGSNKQAAPRKRPTLMLDLENARKAKKFSRAQLAAQLQIGLGRYNQLLAGYKQPTTDEQLRFSQWLQAAG